MVLDEPDVLGFLDVRPVFKGHVLIVPREHHRNIFDLPAAETGPLFETVQRTSDAVKAAFDADGVLVISNNGVSQSVDHLHVHVIPRNKKDGLRGFMWPRLKYDSDEEAASYAARVALQIKAV